MMVELTDKELGTIKCALARYKEFCDNCISAFAGTGHDDYYKGRKEETEKLQEKIYMLKFNMNGRINENINGGDKDDNEG